MHKPKVWNQAIRSRPRTERPYHDPDRQPTLFFTLPFGNNQFSNVCRKKLCLRIGDPPFAWNLCKNIYITDTRSHATKYYDIYSIAFCVMYRGDVSE